jgi:protein TonB
MRTGGWRAEGRVPALVGSAILHLAALALLLFWPAARREDRPRDALITIALPPPTAAPTPEANGPPAADRKVTRAAPAGTPGALATPVPILAAALPLALPSAAPSAGLADGDDSRRGGGLAGIGPGGGGSGAGLGGNGGRGADRGDGSPPVRIRGELKNSDYPKEARKAGQQGRVETEITVDPKGRPSACAVTRSSGSAELDRATCRLIMHRFRYAPARDRSGKAVAGIATYDLDWVYRQARGE